MKTIIDLFFEHSKDKTKKALINVHCTTFTYNELWKRSIKNFANRIDYTAREGDRILIMSKQHDDSIVMFLSALYNNCIPVMVNPNISQTKLDYIIDDCKPAFIYRSFNNNTVFKENSGTKIDKKCDFILYTSGSLGEQKGVCCTHEGMMAAITEINKYLEHTSKDRILCHLPLYHSYGLYQALCMFAVGGTIVFEKNSALPTELLKRIMDEQITGFPTTPTTVSMLLRFELIEHIMGSLRYITTAGANFPEHYKRELESKVTCAIIPMYGATECVRITYRPGKDNHGNSTGILLPGMKAMLVDENEMIIKTPGEIGELWVSGDNVMNGYLNKPIQEANTFRTDMWGTRWYCTGDMFYVDMDGFYYFCSRKDDLIKVKGEKVSPIEVEAEISKMEGIEQVIITTAPNSTVGNFLVAHVILDGTQPLKKNDIMKFCKHNLEPHLMPKTVEIWKKYPLVEGSNKIDRNYLKKYAINTMYGKTT